MNNVSPLNITSRSDTIECGSLISLMVRKFLTSLFGGDIDLPKAELVYLRTLNIFITSYWKSRLLQTIPSDVFHIGDGASMQL